jgi:hypothetical protein
LKDLKGDNEDLVKDPVYLFNFITKILRAKFKSTIQI